MTDPAPGVRAARASSAGQLVRVLLREPFHRRARAELGYLVVSSVLACTAAVAFVALGLVGLALAVLLVGIGLLAGLLRAARQLGRCQRALSRWLLGQDIPEPEPFRPRPGLLGTVAGALTDRTAWRTVGYVVAKVPLALFGGAFAVGAWVLAVAGVLSPLTGRAGTARLGAHFALFLGGLVLLVAAPWATRLVVTADRRLMLLLLGPDAASARVRALEDSRARTLGEATATLQRIERDLHDGTQAQLVALAMRLGQAKDRLAGVGGGVGEALDLDAARRLVDEAHRGAKEAITDLRDLARGIHPPALETGLETALPTLAARSPVRTELEVSIRSRPSPPIEAISYFCAAELLANVAQHAGASTASLSCVQSGNRLRVVVSDDGHGGATAAPVGSRSSGLAGLADRVRTVDGRLSIDSPPGGPTCVTVDLPLRA